MVDEVAADGKIKITLTANREIKAISIDKALLSDAEELEDYLILALNNAHFAVLKPSTSLCCFQ